ncbi:MAG: LPS assembly lipoprotein LptE [Pseudomonadales bacterium]|nr:LPS assembly lipoprotein LptE [Pseudomonadales bacterium]
MTIAISHLYSSLVRTALLVLVMLSVTACGFALRGTESITAQYDSLALDVDQPNSELARLLRRSLDVANVSVQPAGPNAPVLSVRNERSVSRPVSINPRARAAQYELRLSVDVTMVQDEEVLLPPETLLVERTYFEDIANIAGNQDEVEIITAEMRRDLVNQLLRRLEADTQ